MPMAGPVAPPFNTEAYDKIDENKFRRVSDDPLSTFSIDVDTASYSNVRRFLNQGTLPPADAVRIEELINYFRFAYKNSDDKRAILGDHRSRRMSLESAPSPRAHRPAGSPAEMREHAAAQSGLPARRLGLDGPARQAAAREDGDAHARRHAQAERSRRIVVYAGASGLVLPSTSGERKADIQKAIADLQPGGSTNGASGIQLAYDIASESFIKGGINRVILATDGDFNVGVTSQGELIRLIEEKREKGIFLSVLGVGTGNLKDSTMEKLADTGNGNYCVPGLAARGPAGADCRSGRDARHRRQGREDPGGVQSPGRRRLQADWLREPDPRASGLQRRQEGCRARSAPATP